MNMKFLRYLICRPILGLMLLLGMNSANAALYSIQSQDVSANGGNMCLTVLWPPFFSNETLKLELRACDKRATQQFDINNAGMISQSAFGVSWCLMLSSNNASSANAGDKIILGECGSININRNLWRYQYSSLATPNGNWCMTMKEGANSQLTIDTCVTKADRKWIINGLPQASQAPNGRPVAKVPNTTLSSSQISELVLWIIAENSIDKTDFCWKKPAYQRPAGSVPASCSGDKIGLICYDPCPSGMDRLSASDQTCAAKCDADFQRTDVRTCFRPLATRAAHFEKCKKGYNTFPMTCTKKTLPYNTYNRDRSCDEGFDWNGSSCTRPAATRSLATKEASYRTQTCQSGQHQEAGLCYAYAKTGFTCTATSCTQQCASGTADCGPVGCAQNTGTCTAAITDMVVSPAIMLASLATAGTAGAAANGVRAAVQKAKDAAELGASAAALALILRDSINDYMAAAEKDLDAISTAEIANQMDLTYHKGSSNYNTVAREYALLQIMMAVSDMTLELEMLAITTMDITGITGTINAFAKPPCEQHRQIPIF